MLSLLRQSALRVGLRSQSGRSRFSANANYDYDDEYSPRGGGRITQPKRVFGRHIPEQRFNKGYTFQAPKVKPPPPQEEAEPAEFKLYQGRPDSSPQAAAKVEEWLQRHAVSVQSSNGSPAPLKPEPALGVDELSLPDWLRRKLDWMETPTVIQSLCWPLALDGRNLVGVAQTGSGKTLGFLVPGLVHSRAQTAAAQGPRVLVLCPTRELCRQVADVSTELKAGTVAVFGGANPGPQSLALQRMPEVVVGTPGRVLDFLSQGVLRLSSASFVVLDEADRMLDMGFEPQIREIFAYIRRQRQTLMFSATWPKEVRQLAQDFLGSNPLNVFIGAQGLTLNKNIRQEFRRVDSYKRIQEAISVIREEPGKILIFTKTRREVDDLMLRLGRVGAGRVLGLHGLKSQTARDSVMDAFRSGACRIMVATDVAARGLDVDDIALVLNFSLPDNMEDYVHRIGRTGRAGATGRALSFLTDLDAPRMNDLMKFLRDSGQEIPTDVEDLSLLSNIRPAKRASNPSLHRRSSDNFSYSKAQNAHLRSSYRSKSYSN